jgi:Peptidase S24-like
VGRGLSGTPAKHATRVWVVSLESKTLPLRSTGSSDSRPPGATEDYAELTTMDRGAFLIRVEDDAMTPRYQAGEYALVEPGTPVEAEDGVLVRLVTGETFLARLASRQGRWRFANYSSTNARTYKIEEVEWVYYVAHPVPAKRIRTR